MQVSHICLSDLSFNLRVSHAGLSDYSFTLKVSHAELSDLGSSACSQQPPRLASQHRARAEVHVVHPLALAELQLAVAAQVEFERKVEGSVHHLLVSST